MIGYSQSVTAARSPSQFNSAIATPSLMSSYIKVILISFMQSNMQILKDSTDMGPGLRQTTDSLSWGIKSEQCFPTEDKHVIDLMRIRYYTCPCPLRRT